MATQNEIHVFCIGEEGEIFAAVSEESARKYYRAMVGDEEAEAAFVDTFYEITDIDTPSPVDIDGKIVAISLRQLVERDLLYGELLPTQLLTTCN